MLRFLKVTEGKPIQILPVSAETKRGAPVTIDKANSEIDNATAVSGFGLVDIAASYDGINAVISHNDAAFETIALGDDALYVEGQVGEKYATTEVTATNLEIGNLLKAASGKFVTGANTELCEWIYQGEYSDPTGLSMYAVSKSLPKAVVTYTVTYNKNDVGASGTMTDAISPYQSGNTVTTKVNTFVAPTDYEFDCWSTAATKTGQGVVNYDEGDTFAITANTTLYAIWKELPEYTVTYDKNSETAVGTVTDANSPYHVGDEVTVAASTLTPPDDYGFKCWCTETTEVEGSISFDPDDTFEIEEDTTLYAIWEELPEYTVTLDKNSAGASGEMTDASSPYHEGDTVTAPTCTFTPEALYEFDCWSTAATKTGEGVINYAELATFEIAANTTLYAIWKLA